jgi:ketosteroid isomerase-like protein
VELVRRGWDAYNRGDIEGTLAIFDPELVVHTAPPMANAGTYHGKQGFLTWIGQWNEAWDSFTAAVLAVETVGERHALTRVRQSGTGRGSGIEVTMESGWVFDVRDGLCVYLGLHQTLEGARAEAFAREACE